MDHQNRLPRRRPGRGEPSLDEARAAHRDRGIRHVRRLSNWTAVALTAATGVTAGYFAHAAAGVPQPATVAGAQAQAPGSHQPCVTVPVATSGGSGVTSAKAPSSCAAGQNGASPAVTRAPSYEEREDQ